MKALGDVISSPIRMDKSESACRYLTTRHGWTSSSRYTFCLAIHVVVPVRLSFCCTYTEVARFALTCVCCSYNLVSSFFAV